jgi:hypothetical protein
MNNLDDHLSGLDGLQNGRTNGLFANTIRKGPDDFKRDVSFQECTPNLAQSCGNVGFRERATSGQPIQNGAKTVLEVFKHCIFLLVPGGPRNFGIPGLKCKTQSQTAPEGATRCRVLTSRIDL